MGHVLGTTSDSSIIIGLSKLAAGTLTFDGAGAVSTLYQRQVQKSMMRSQLLNLLHCTMHEDNSLDGSDYGFGPSPCLAARLTWGTF